MGNFGAGEGREGEETEGWKGKGPPTSLFPIYPLIKGLNFHQVNPSSFPAGIHESIRVIGGVWKDILPKLLP